MASREKHASIDIRQKHSAIEIRYCEASNQRAWSVDQTEHIVKPAIRGHGLLIKRSMVAFASACVRTSAKKLKRSMGGFATVGE